MATAEDEPVVRKGILKHPSSNLDEGVRTLQRQTSDKKGATWDEMNILETYHPADKDYGYKKIDEPPTPYNRLSFSENEEESTVSADEAICLDEECFAASLESSGDAKIFQRMISDGNDDDDNEETCLTEEEIAKRKAFEEKRKHHYNEFLEAKRLQEMLNRNEDNDEEEDAPADEVKEASRDGAKMQDEELQ